MLAATTAIGLGTLSGCGSGGGGGGTAPVQQQPRNRDEILSFCSDFVGSQQTVRSLSFSGDSRMLATAAARRDLLSTTLPSGNEVEVGNLKIWDFPSGALRHSIPLPVVPGSGPCELCAVALNHNGSLVAASGQACLITVWDTDSGEQLMEWPAHDGNVYISLKFSLDGQILVSGGGDDPVKKTGTTVLWNYTGPWRG